MLYNLSNEYDRERLGRWLEEQTGKGAWIECTSKVRRTLKQNSYLHLLLGFFASEFGYTLDEVKVDVFKRMCNRELFERERVNKRGQSVRMLRSTAELTTAELSQAIERFRNWSASECGLYLPEAGEREFINYCRQQVERFVKG